jgi:5-oxoprolinase (ATP-hydrolysing)
LVVDGATAMSAACAVGWRFRALHDADENHHAAVAAAALDEGGGLRIKLDHAWKGVRKGGEAIELFSDEPAPILAARLATQTPMDRALPEIAMRLGTTRGTNALLERRVARTALFVTRGFRDLLTIGDQQRPELFALKIEKSPPLYETVIEVSERIAADGSVLEAVDRGDLRSAAIEARDNGFLVAFRDRRNSRR